MRHADDVEIGGLTLRFEIENVPVGMGDSISFEWFSVYVGVPDPYQGPLAKFKVRQHAEAYAASVNKVIAQ